MFQKIYLMYSDINNNKETNAALLLTIMSYYEDINKFSETKVTSHENHHNEYPFQVWTFSPPDLHQIQERATKVWNCDEIWLDPNGKWRKVVCTYKYFQEERMWKVQTGDRAPFWCTLPVFTQADGQYFMYPVVVHQDKE